MAHSQSKPPPRRPQDRRHLEEQARQWSARLVARYLAAANAEERTEALLGMDQPHILDEDAALALYRLEPQLSSPFVQRHLPAGRRVEDERLPWHRLMGHALSRGDQELYFALYRRQAPAEQWLRETAELAQDLANTHTLCAELERRHPQRWRPEIGSHLVRLAQQCGEAMLPYLMKHVDDVWSNKRRSGYLEMVDLARSRDWWELTCAVLRAGAATIEYDREVLLLANDRIAPEPKILHRLLLLAGVGAAPSVRARRHKPLREDTILALYERFPHLVRGPFRSQIDPSPRRPLTGVLELAIRHKDDELIDMLAARLAVRGDRSGADQLLQAAAYTARHLQTSSVEEGQAERRAAAILKRIPAGAIRNQREVMRRNPLTGLLFERAEKACLHYAEDAASLLQAEERHVCALAVGALASDSPEALLRARENLDALLGCLDRPLPRSVIRRALHALALVADSSARAAHIVGWARAKLATQDPRFSKEALVSLVGHQLHRFPALSRAVEQPVIYRRAAA